MSKSFCPQAVLPAKPAQDQWPDQVQEILQDPAASFWLKGAITSALQRHPVDALQDAATLISILWRRATAALAHSGSAE